MDKETEELVNWIDKYIPEPNRELEKDIEEGKKPLFCNVCNQTEGCIREDDDRYHYSPEALEMLRSGTAKPCHCKDGPIISVELEEDDVDAIKYLKNNVDEFKNMSEGQVLIRVMEKFVAKEIGKSKLRRAKRRM